MDHQIHKIIRSEATTVERLDGYHQIIKILQEEKEIPANLLKNVGIILKLLKQDITSEHVKTAQDSLNFMGVLLSIPAVVNIVNNDILRAILNDICIVIRNTTEKAICTRALWCLTKQKMPSSLYADKVVDILRSLELASETFNKSSVSVQIEAIKVLNRLLIEMPDALSIRTGLWARRLYISALHPMNKVREAAMVALLSARPCFEKQQCELLSKLILDLKETLVPGMLKLFKDKQELHVLKLWNILLDILGKTLHQGATLINNLLAVVEKAFKSPVPEVKIAAFNCWQHLINNFGTELDVLANPKRLRLVMQPLKANNARAESIAIVKFNVWWHLAINLESRLSSNVEMVLYPLLQLCFGISETATINQIGSPTSNGVNLAQSPGTKLNTSASINSSITMGLNFASLHHLGCEALAQILGHSLSLSITTPTYSIENLSYSVLSSPSLFLRHAKMLFMALKEAVVHLTAEKKDLHLQLYLWHSVIAHIRCFAEAENLKDASEPMTEFLNLIEEFVKSSNPAPEVTLKLLEAMTFLPQRMLTSSALNISSASVMHGTPALFLVTLLFHPPILRLCCSQERFLSVFQKFVSVGINSNLSLGFVHSVIKALDLSVQHVDQSESLYQLWSTIVFPLLESIQKTQEVNEGDALEHDFNCFYAVLLFPVQHLINKPLLQTSFKTLVRVWGDLFRIFAACAALVPNAEANTSCEEFCFRILQNLNSNDMQSLPFLDMICQLILIMISSVDFTATPASDLNSDSNTSPTSWSKRKSKPLGNLTSLIRLIEKIINSVSNILKPSLDESSETFQQSNASLCLKVHGNLTEVIRSMYSQLTSSTLIGSVTTILASSLAKLFKDSTCQLGINKIQQGQIFEKLEIAWNALATCFETSYEGPYDSEFLAVFSPLFEETFMCQRKNIRSKTRTLWRSTFGPLIESLTVPESLKEILKVAQPLLLPENADDDDDMMDDIPGNLQEESVIEDTEKVSNLATAVTEHIALDEQLEKPSSGPETATSDIATSGKRKRMDALDDNDDDDDFVPIAPDAKKCRILTEHQKTLMSTSSVIPALYNDLSQSQDIPNISSQFIEDVDSQSMESKPADESRNDDNIPVISEDHKMDVFIEPALDAGHFDNEKENLYSKAYDSDQILHSSSIDESAIIVDRLLSQVEEFETNDENAVNKTKPDVEDKSVEIADYDMVDETVDSPVNESQSLLEESPIQYTVVSEKSLDLEEDQRNLLESNEIKVMESDPESCVEIVINNESSELPTHDMVVIESESASTATPSLDELKETNLVSDQKLLTQTVIEINRASDEEVVEICDKNGIEEPTDCQNKAVNDEILESNLEISSHTCSNTSKSSLKYVDKEKVEDGSTDLSVSVQDNFIPDDDNVIPSSQSSDVQIVYIDINEGLSVHESTASNLTHLSEEKIDNEEELSPVETDHCTYDSHEIYTAESSDVIHENELIDSSQSQEEKQTITTPPKRRGRPPKKVSESSAVPPSSEEGRTLRSKLREAKVISETLPFHKKNLRGTSDSKITNKLLRNERPKTCNKSTETDKAEIEKTVFRPSKVQSISYTTKTARKSLPNYNRNLNSNETPATNSRSKRPMKQSLKTIRPEEVPCKLLRNRFSFSENPKEECFRPFRRDIPFKIYRSITIQTDNEIDVSPVTLKESTSDSDNILIDNVQMPSDGDSADKIVQIDNDAVDCQVLPLIVGDTVEVISKSEDAEHSSISNVSNDNQQQLDTETVHQQASESLSDLSSEIIIQEKMSDVENLNEHGDKPNDIHVQMETSISHSASEKNDAEFPDKVFSMEGIPIPLSDDTAITMRQENSVNVTMDAEVASTSALRIDNAGLDKDEVIYMISDMSDSVLDSDTVASNVLINSGLEYEIEKENELPAIPESSMICDDTGDEMEGCPDSPQDRNDNEEDNRHDSNSSIKMKSNKKGRKFNQAFLELQMRAEDDSLNFIPQRNTKTYSRDISTKSQNKSFIIKSDSDTALSAVPPKARFLDKINSRAGRMLEAAKKNLNSYEKMKYEQRRSPERVEDGGVKFIVSSDDNCHITLDETETTGNGFAELLLEQMQSAEHFIASPSDSPTSGILKKRKIEVVSSISSPTYRNCKTGLTKLTNNQLNSCKSCKKIR